MQKVDIAQPNERAKSKPCSFARVAMRAQSEGLSEDEADQLTVNRWICHLILVNSQQLTVDQWIVHLNLVPLRYLPGQGIPSHTDR